MDNSNWVNLFNQLYPDWFMQDYIKNISPETIHEEMVMFLSDFDYNDFSDLCPDNISFGYFDGEMDTLYDAVKQVDENWQQFFNQKSPIYCAYVNGEIASFCFEEDFKSHVIENKEYKIAGPACVGTIPKYRRKGIGLAMIAKVTENLKNKGYDISFIHFTGVANWYKKLGYKSVIKWNCNGIIN